METGSKGTFYKTPHFDVRLTPETTSWLEARVGFDPAKTYQVPVPESDRGKRREMLGCHHCGKDSPKLYSLECDCSGAVCLGCLMKPNTKIITTEDDFHVCSDCGNKSDLVPVENK